MHFWSGVFAALVVSVAVHAQPDEYRIGDSVEFYEQGWYFNLDGQELTDLVQTASEENNRVATVAGYHVTGAGTRFVARVVDQPPPRRLGLVDNPNWYAWYVYADLTRANLYEYIDRFHYRQNFRIRMDSYYTPQGVRYVVVMHRRNEHRDDTSYRQNELVGLLNPQWAQSIQSVIRSGDHPYSTSSAVTPRGEVEFSALINPGRYFDTNFRQNPQWEMTAPRFETWHEQSLAQNMPVHHFDMTPGLRGGPVRYSGLAYDGAGHTWYNAWDGRGGAGQTLVLEIPGRQLAERLAQISEQGRYIRLANAVERYHGGGPENDVVYALVVSGSEPLPDLPLGADPWGHERGPEIILAEPTRPPPPAPDSILNPVEFAETKPPRVEPSLVQTGSAGASETTILGNSHGLDEIRDHIRDDIHALRIHIIVKRHGRLDWTVEPEGPVRLDDPEHWYHLDSRSLMSNPAVFEQIIRARLRSQGITPSGNFRINTSGMIRRGGIIAGTNIGGGLVN